ncbi:MAG: hypothetical protein IKD36_00475 [Clostridia bacterium]|nr:hypothetical protein [Clostridia bacterium]
MAVKYSLYSMKQRLLALFVLVTFFACGITFRIFYLQVLNSLSYIEKGMTQWLRDLPLVASRGTITDRNGVVLASSHTTYDVYVRPADIENVETVAKILSENLNLDYEKTYEKVSKKNQSEIKIATGIEKKDVQKILQNYQKGIMFASNTKRDYVYDEMLCQVLGFVGGDNVGQTGIESFYNTYLAGTNGVSLVESDLKGSSLENAVTYYEDAINGLNLTLTIDFKIQKIVEERLKRAMNETGAKSVSCMVASPKTGEILSVCTLPSYNLNDIPREDMSALNRLSRASTIVDTLEPGSTFKAIVAAIAIEEGLAGKGSYFYCGGFRLINGVKINCSRRSGHGSQSLEQGLMNSCNCVFMDLIQRIGLKKFYDYLNRLGFSGSLGIDFPGEVAAVLMPQSLVTAPDLARMGFGQTIALSPLHMVTGFSSVINGGVVYQPNFIKQIKTETGKVVYSRTATIHENIFSENTSRLMREMLFSVVFKGGGRYAAVEGYPIIGGKTGTAQKYENNAIAQGKYIASFIGFAPYDDPKYVVYVIVDEPQGAYYGGVVAAPIASDIFKGVFEGDSEINKKDGVQERVENIELDTLIGMTLTQSAGYLQGKGIQYLVQGDGDYVTSQVPAPGAMLAEGDIVLLKFE